MALSKLTIPPDQASYSVVDGIEVASVELDGGKSRYRRDIIGAASKVNAVWTLNPEEFKYLRLFYRISSEKGAIPFLIDLYLDLPALTEHISNFVPGSMKLQSQRGLTFVVSCVLEVIPIDDDPTEEDLLFLLLFNEFGSNWETQFLLQESSLNDIINVQLPSFLQ